MKKALTLIVLSLVMGCASEAPEVQPTPPPQPVAPPPQPVPPIVIPAPPAAPSTDFMTGYWDGYTGRWISPIKWVVGSDYRNGHQLGSQDRVNKVQPRYPRPGKMSIN